MRQHSAESGRVALGFRAHSGWAAMVALRDPIAAPLVVLRRHLQLVDREQEGAAQPFHAAEKMPLHEAEAFIQERREDAEARATSEVRNAIGELAAKGYSVGGACVLLGSGRPTVNLAATLASHTLIHTAEGDFFRDALKKACDLAGIVVCPIKEKEVSEKAASHLRIKRDVLEQRIAEMGKTIGPPWRQDEKLCAIAAWIILVGRNLSVAGPDSSRRKDSIW